MISWEAFPPFQEIWAKSWDGHCCSPQRLTCTELWELLPLLWAALGVLFPKNTHFFFLQFMARYPLSLKTSCQGALPDGRVLGSLSRAEPTAAAGTRQRFPHCYQPLHPIARRIVPRRRDRDRIAVAGSQSQGTQGHASSHTSDPACSARCLF